MAGRGTVMAAVIGLSGCLGAPAPSRVLEVDAVEEGVAVVVDRSGGPPLRVRSSALPSGTREGDVVVDGRLDRELSNELRLDVRRAHGRLRRVEHQGRIDLEADEPPRAPVLTAGEPESLR